MSRRTDLAAADRRLTARIAGSGRGIDDTALYRDIVAHRRRFYHVGGVDYSLDLPQHIDFVPSGGLAARFRADYEAMRGSMIYGAAPSFDTLTAHLAELRRRFREVGEL